MREWATPEREAQAIGMVVHRILAGHNAREVCEECPPITFDIAALRGTELIEGTP